MMYFKTFLRWGAYVEKRLDTEDYDRVLVGVSVAIDDKNKAGVEVSLKWNAVHTESELVAEAMWRWELDARKRGKLCYKLYLRALQKIKDKTNRHVNPGFPSPEKISLPDELYEQLKTLFSEEDF